MKQTTKGSNMQFDMCKKKKKRLVEKEAVVYCQNLLSQTFLYIYILQDCQ